MELLDIATQHASGEEAIMAVFVLGMGKLSSAVAGQHYPKQPAKPLRKALKATRRSKSDALMGQCHDQ
jgi:hypothetical protein